VVVLVVGGWEGRGGRGGVGVGVRGGGRGRGGRGEVRLDEGGFM
jgi:hypothetical protein